MAKVNWSKDWSVGIRVCIERDGSIILSERAAELLAEIGRRRSITKAAKAAGMSYRKAWTVVQEINQAAGDTLVQAAVGGVKGGGAKLTERGRFAQEVYDEVRRTMHEAAAMALERTLGSANAASCLHLAAAISLQEVVGELLAVYALKQPTVKIRAVFGASNELADHVLSGAACDIFISAEQTELDRLHDAKKLVPRSRRTIALNGLSAITQRATFARSATGLLSNRIGRVALAEPACPLGKYSKRYLETLDLYEKLAPKVVHVDNSRAVLTAVTSGPVDAGLAFTSDASRSRDCRTLFDVPPSQVSAEYAAALVRTGKRSREANAFLEFMLSREAAKCFRRCGFRGPRG
jgi:molybdate transport system substrate-binding protein